MGQTGAIHRRQKGEATIGICHIEVNARDVSEIAGVLMSLKKEMAAVIVVMRRTTRVMIHDEISVFIRLSANASA